MARSRFNNNDLFIALSDLRSAIRNGTVTLYFRTDPDALRKAVAATLSLQDADAFNTENFNPQTLKRFATLFAVPRRSETSTSKIAAWRYPSQDDAAKALQNFINRRANPWSHFRDDTVSATSADPIASLVQENG